MHADLKQHEGKVNDDMIFGSFGRTISLLPMTLILSQAEPHYSFQSLYVKLPHI